LAGISIGSRRFNSPPVWTLVDAFGRESGGHGQFPPPLGRVSVLLEEQDVNGQFRKLDAPLELAYTRTLSGALALSMRTVPRNADEPRRTIAAGRYRFRITSEFYQEAIVDAVLADGVNLPPNLGELRPGAAYPFPLSARGQGISATTLLRGAYRNADGTPVDDADVIAVAPINAWPFRACRTDRAGQWVIVVPDSEFAVNPSQPLPVTVRFARPGGAQPIDLMNVRVSRGRENSLAQTAVRGFVQDTRGRAIAGATVAIAGELASVTTDSAGRWFFYFALDRNATPATITVSHPDGRTQTQAVPIVERAMTVVPTFRFP
jgi:hypothetical protein